MEENDNDLLYVCPTTLDCALTNTCLPCLYKLFPDGTLPSQEVLELPPNQRPENCPRSQPHTVYSGLYTASHRMLTVGDGDFSFSLSLANGIQSMSSSSGSSRGSSNRCQLTATSHESLAQLHITYESVGIVDKLAQLQAHGVTVLHGVDATQLSATTALHQQQYDVIIWNFPCVRAPKGADGQATEIDINKQLLRDFFRNAHDYLTPRGQLHIAHKTIEPFSWWDIKSLAMEQGFQHVLSLVFDRYLYPGYVNRKVLDKKSFPTSDARVFVFVSCKGRGDTKTTSGGSTYVANKDRGDTKTTSGGSTHTRADITTIPPVPQDLPPMAQRDKRDEREKRDERNERDKRDEREEIARVLGVVSVDLALDRLQSVVKKMVGASASAGASASMGKMGKPQGTTTNSAKLLRQHKDKGSAGDKRKKTGGGDSIGDEGSGRGSGSSGSGGGSGSSGSGGGSGNSGSSGGNGGSSGNLKKNKKSRLG